MNDLLASLDALLDSASRLRSEYAAVPFTVEDRTKRAAECDSKEESAALLAEVTALRESIAAHFKTVVDAVTGLPALAAEALGVDAPTIGAN